MFILPLNLSYPCKAIIVTVLSETVVFDRVLQEFVQIIDVSFCLFLFICFFNCLSNVNKFRIHFDTVFGITSKLLFEAYCDYGWEIT